MNLGICLAGVEDQFERALIEHAKRVVIDHSASPAVRFHYMEIGTANCDTFLAVQDILSRSVEDFYMIGIDPSEEAKEAYEKRFENNKAHSILINLTREDAFRAARDWIGDRLDFVFIDGCHAKKCVVGDFLAVEPLVVPGGLVVFHDIDQPSGELQPHCNAGQNVCGALEELGLWQNTRPGWKRLPDWVADRSKNGFSCGVFEKQ